MYIFILILYILFIKINLFWLIKEKRANQKSGFILVINLLRVFVRRITQLKTIQGYYFLIFAEHTIMSQFLEIPYAKEQIVESKFK